MIKTRAIATAECHYERAYLRTIFAAITSPRRLVEELPEEVVEPPETAPVLQVLTTPGPGHQVTGEAA